ncbi:hypothetical protein HP499_08100 [Paenarthrobacter sp. CM16]|uniref:hypothetical protein n=1 Tax=Paenarthrobacter sp. CM16 TaxID=2738447 RepID=UPI001554965F|nr:hypothetical protein [Paenarthrobacter sp. CM16]NQD87764.1 hypothetical protein [Paenarthrobacter sp. CM16]
MLHSFEDDPRTPLQREIDLDSADVTISMYAVTDRAGERKARSVFRAESTDWVAVTGTYRQFRAESGFSSPGMPAYEEAGHVWVIADKASSAGILRIAGAAEVHPNRDGGELAWVWVHPLRRGSGKQFTPSLVNRLLEEYGTITALEEDVNNGALTAAGRHFLQNYFQPRSPNCRN